MKVGNMQAKEKASLIVMAALTPFLQEENPIPIQSRPFQSLLYVGPIHQGETLIVYMHPDLLSATPGFDREDGPPP